MATVIAILFLCSLLLPSVANFFRGLRATWLLFVIWVAVVLLEQRWHLGQILAVIAKRKRVFIVLFMWTLIILVNMLLGRGFTGSIHLMSAVTLGMIVLMEMSHTSLDDGSHDRIVYVLIILLGIETARSIPTLWNEPLLARAGMSADAPTALKSRRLLVASASTPFTRVLP